MAEFGDRSFRRSDSGGGSEGAVQRSAGKRSLVEARYGVQRRRDGQAALKDEQVHAAAEAGLGQPASALPHADRIQAAFGHHDVSGVAAHVGGAASAASDAMGAEAYATGNHVAFRATPDLHTAAHEAAHVVQQRGGVSLKGGVGEAGDPYEQHADAVADAVVAGRSTAGLLDDVVGSGASGGAVQRKNLTQHGKASGLTDTGATAAVVNRSKAGKVYSQDEATAQGNRTAALTKASEHAAVVGNRTVGLEWTKDDANFNDDGAASLDPFLFKVTVPFGKTEEDKSPELLELTYQHADRWTGYVTGIEDTTNDATKGGVKMVNGREDTSHTKGTYGNEHDQGKTASTNVASDTDGDKEENLDAYTKIAGEGARWQCVRNHAANLQNDAMFFTAVDEKNVAVVTFVELWLNWVGAFGPRYDIPDSDVVKAMKGQIVGKGKKHKGIEQPGQAALKPAVKTVDRSTLTTKDYDLDAGKSHAVK